MPTPFPKIGFRVTYRVVVLAIGRAAAATLLMLAASPAVPAQPPQSQPSPNPHIQTDSTGMSGQPLAVDDLPPGTVTVRVIRRSFSDNIAGHPVDLQVLAADGVELQEMTDASGRATFSNLPIGATVLVRTSVDEERLTSQQFEVPAQGGVRLALVAGIGAGGNAGRSADLPPGHPPLDAAPPSAAARPAASNAAAAAAPSDSIGATAIMATLTIVVAALIGWSVLRKR